MPRKAKGDIIRAEFFRWVLYQRDGRYYADGRSVNEVNLGRHSLDTNDLQQALVVVRDLDRTLAVKNGKADRSVLTINDEKSLSLEQGRAEYEKFARRAKVTGGVSKGTQKRYRAVFDKFLLFVHERGIASWNRVNADLLHNYASHLEEDDYQYRTIYLELTTIKQTMGWLIRKQLIPESCDFSFPMEKAIGTTTYCYSQREVTAMINYCAAEPSLHWMGELITTLAYTGLRISEARDLKWSDLDDQLTRMRIIDESTRAKKVEAGRTTKSGRDRVVPIHNVLRAKLETMRRHSDGRVFHGPLGGALKPDTVRIILQRDVLAAVAKKLGVAGKHPSLLDGRLHSFRHFFCSLCASSPHVKEPMVRLWLGHSDSKMLDHYFHLSDRAAQHTMNSICLAADSAALAEQPVAKVIKGDAEADRKNA